MEGCGARDGCLFGGDTAAGRGSSVTMGSCLVGEENGDEDKDDEDDEDIGSSGTRVDKEDFSRGAEKHEILPSKPDGIRKAQGTLVIVIRRASSPGRCVLAGTASCCD